MTTFLGGLPGLSCRGPRAPQAGAPGSRGWSSKRATQINFGRPSNPAEPGNAPPPPVPPEESRPSRRRRRGDTLRRVYCPVAGCPAGNASDAPGWDSVDNMRNHLEAHRMGQYDGIIPANWLEAQRLVTCGHCNRLVVGTEGAMHRTCRAEARSTDASSVSPIDLPAGSSSAIDVEGILLANRPSLRYIPKKCRTLWSAVLSRALSAVVLVSSAGSRCTPGQRDLPGMG